MSKAQAVLNSLIERRQQEVNEKIAAEKDHAFLEVPLMVTVRICQAGLLHDPETAVENAAYQAHKELQVQASRQLLENHGSLLNEANRHGEPYSLIFRMFNREEPERPSAHFDRPTLQNLLKELEELEAKYARHPSQSVRKNAKSLCRMCGQDFV